ncbi:MAG: ligase-associated DNA damage response DEXH box helicase [Planctomycetota bacterium]
MSLVQDWFASQGWTPWEFQLQAWAAQRAGRSGLIQVPTGSGKTYAAYGGALATLIDSIVAGEAATRRILYITPLRAVSRDVELALKAPLADLASKVPGLKRVRVESRTGDTKSSLRAKQKESLPDVLVTTPESLSLMLTWERSGELFAGLRCVIVDEWHELISSKRGTQVELGLARLRRLAPGLVTWGLSATLPNANEAAAALAGVPKAGEAPVIVRAQIDRPVVVTTLLPERVEAFPWAGHLGLTMLSAVIASLAPAGTPPEELVSTLFFTNTRSQAELWHRALTFQCPHWESVIALHHGSIDRAERERVELGIKTGSIRLVIATSSLDLGVDFAPVERVYHVGSPKGIGRVIQRAGRASHRPGASCSIICVPTHGLELIEIDAVRRAIAAGEVEPRTPLDRPLDVLAQHLVTCSLGSGSTPDDLFEEVRTAWSYRNLTREEFDWTLALVTHGGKTLGAYPNYRRVVPDELGLLRVPVKRIAHQHRMNIGTIVSEAVLDLRYVSGRRLGTIEENFVTFLKPGQYFRFAGKALQFVGIHDLSALVRPAKSKTSFTPKWVGTKLPISESLSLGIRRTLALARDLSPKNAKTFSRELAAARPILEAQARLSRLPDEDETLVELTRTRDGTHLFVYPFDGRLVHAGLAAVLALRLTRLSPTTFTTAVNDYGLELLTSEKLELDALITPELFTTLGLAADIEASMDMAEVAKLPFREIARVSGLIQQNHPGARTSGRQQQASAGLLYDVFREYDPGNLLLEQARREVVERHFEQSRLARSLTRIAASRITVVRTERPTPLGFPLIVARTSAELSGEPLAERLRKMVEQWEER